MDHDGTPTEQNNRRRAIDGMTKRLVSGGMERREAVEKAKDAARRRDVLEKTGRMKRRP